MTVHSLTRKLALPTFPQVDDLQNVLQLNFVSVFALCKFSLPHLRATRGNVINVSSLVGAIGQAKAAVAAQQQQTGKEEEGEESLLSSSPATAAPST